MAPKDAGTPRDAGVLREGGGADVPFAYAVIARCPPLGSRSTIDDLTIAVSHEMIEASTDPFVQTNTAYDFVDPSNAAWLFGFTSDPLGEVADLCVYDSGDGLLDQYTVTRSWSNRAAASGLDPCVPSSGTYYGAAPIVQDSVSINGILATGLSIPVGGSKTVDVHLFSAAPTAAWFVTAIEGPLQAPANTLDLTWNQVSGKNGDVLKLTVMRRDRGPFDGSSVVLIASSLQGFRSGYLDGSVWPMVVGD
jgi:hypothetical protein